MPKPAAQAEPVRRALTQAEIDAAIQEWNGNIESKHAVVRYMKDHAREKDTAAWLRQEYGDDLPALPVTVDGAAGDVPWPKVQRRIVQLIKEDRFYTEAEQDRFDNIDPIAIREALAERGIVNGQVVDPEKLDSDPFIRQVMRDVEAVATEEQAEAAAKPPVPDLSGQPVTREGDTLTIGSGEPTHEIDITVSDEEYAAIRDAMKMRGITLANPLAMLEYRVVPLLIAACKIGEELSAAALSRGLGAPVRRTNVCRVGFGWLDIAAIVLTLPCWLALILGVMA